MGGLNLHVFYIQDPNSHTYVLYPSLKRPTDRLLPIGACHYIWVCSTGQHQAECPFGLYDKTRWADKTGVVCGLAVVSFAMRVGAVW